ncbi:MAG: mannitol dehydrogenase family protein [Candidatus Solibacter sp.]|jgi:mannitol 2-dehydrogenase
MPETSRTPIELRASNLRLIPPAVAVPAYNRRDCAQHLVHIGVGGFHRAHQAVYLDDLLQSGECPGWGICGVGLLPQDRAMHAALEPQDCLYTVVEASGTARDARVIGSVLDHLYAPDNPEAVLARMADPQCRIVSLTITEGGYRVNRWTGEFEDWHPDIQHDLEHPHRPAGCFGYLAEALDRRRQRGVPPFTVLSCDNLQHNGDVARKAVLAFAGRRDADLAGWLADNGAFPNSMVDRITPATTDEHRRMVEREFGIRDAWPVVTEPFRQWIVEDRFSDGRPGWEQAGVLMTSDVLPYEKVKMRLLNAGHQALCYLGMLLGYEYVHQAIQDEQIRRLIRTLMDDEVTPLLPQVPGIDLEEYKATLLRRFANAAIRDRLSRIGTDSSVRIREFVLPSILEQLARGGPIRMLSLAVAGWFRYLAGTDERGGTLEIVDPLATRLTECARSGGADAGALLGIREVFGDALPAAARFRALVAEALRGIYQDGTRATLAAWVGSGNPSVDATYQQQ